MCECISVCVSVQKERGQVRTQHAYSQSYEINEAKDGNMVENK